MMHLHDEPRHTPSPDETVQFLPVFQPRYCKLSHHAQVAKGVPRGTLRHAATSHVVIAFWMVGQRSRSLCKQTPATPAQPDMLHFVGQRPQGALVATCAFNFFSHYERHCLQISIRKL